MFSVSRDPRYSAPKTPKPPAPAQYPVYEYPPRRTPDDPVRDPAVRPRLLQSTRPEYTAKARRMGIGGTVVLEIVVERDGRVSGGRVLEPLFAGLTENAVECVRQWRYEPARDARGLPVRALETVTIEFRPHAK